MKFTKTVLTSTLIAAFMIAAAAVSFAQDKSSGAIKGKVCVETGTPSGVTVVQVPTAVSPRNVSWVMVVPTRSPW